MRANELEKKFFTSHRPARRVVPVVVAKDARARARTMRFLVYFLHRYVDFRCARARVVAHHFRALFSRRERMGVARGRVVGRVALARARETNDTH